MKIKTRDIPYVGEIASTGTSSISVLSCPRMTVSLSGHPMGHSARNLWVQVTLATLFSSLLLPSQD
jgi:hypothetical protein